MSKKCRRYFLKDKETRAILGKVSDRIKLDFGQVFRGKILLEIVETEFAEFYLIDGRPVLVKIAGNLFPTLCFSEFLAHAPKAVVDMGAIPYVCKGANVMAPGVRRFEGQFKKGDLVAVVDEKYDKPIAIGEACLDVEEASVANQGIVIKNVHFVNDKTWRFIRDFVPKN